ncbi:MAG: two-component regulator propeller domain-containing protein, partial [Calditrichota bacterium]
MLQDSYGFIWFGTDDGLNRFDGYNIKVYRHILNDITSLSDNVIWSLFEDQEGFLWIGTKTGKLNKYNPYKDRFENWFLPFNDTEEKSITFITQDKNKLIWIGTYRNGLYRFDPLHNKFDNWQNLPGEPPILSNNYVTSILEDDFGNIWIATFNGIDRYEPGNSEKPFSQIFNESEKTSDLSNIPVWYLNKSSFFGDLILAGTLNGLVSFNPVTLKYSKIKFPENPDSQFGNSVSSAAEEIFADEKIIWIATYGGLVRNNFTTGKSQRFIQSPKDYSGLLSNQVHDIIIDNSGVVWVATENGINYYSPKRSKFNFGMSLNNNLL